MPPRPKWSLPLTRPIEIKSGPTLRTLKDAADYVLSKRQDDEPRQHVAGALVHAAQLGDVSHVSRQIEAVLWHRRMWVLPPK